MYYDREADIVYIELTDGEVARTIEYEWGLIDVDANATPIGAEYWSASQRLPAELLAALPGPAARVRARAS